MRSDWAMARLSAASGVTPFRESGSMNPVDSARTSHRAWHSVEITQKMARVGMIFNGRAHGNRARASVPSASSTDLDWAAPRTQADLHEALERFAARRIDTIVVDGGDGTIRDILTIAPTYFTHGLPQLAIVPSGKTNALASDLGIPQDWTVADALDAIAVGRTKQRPPIEISRDGDNGQVLRGFLFGAGAFVKGTAIAQDTHRMGAFRGFAVGLSLAAAIGQTLFAGKRNHWRVGDMMRIELPDGRRIARPIYFLLGTTLKRLPLGFKPFGHVRSGLKLLGVDAPPRHLLATLPALLMGSEAAWLERSGYHRADLDSLRLSLDTGFILDGETYEGGDFTIRQGAPIDFVVP